MPSLIQPLLRTMTPARYPPHLTPALSKSHSQRLPSSRCIESADTLQWDPHFLAGGASDTALGLRTPRLELRDQTKTPTQGRFAPLNGAPS